MVALFPPFRAAIRRYNADKYVLLVRPE